MNKTAIITKSSKSKEGLEIKSLSKEINYLKSEGYVVTDLSGI